MLFGKSEQGRADSLAGHAASNVQRRAVLLIINSMRGEIQYDVLAVETPSDFP